MQWCVRGATTKLPTVKAWQPHKTRQPGAECLAQALTGTGGARSVAAADFVASTGRRALLRGSDGGQSTGA